MTAIYAVSAGGIAQAQDLNQYRSLLRGGQVFDMLNGYGIVGDGSDEYAAMQAVIDAAKLVNGTVVFSPPPVRYGQSHSLVADGPVTLVVFGKASPFRQSSWGVPSLEVRSDDVRILGSWYAEYTGSRTAFDAAALTASNNSATVKAECAGDPKAAGAAIYLATSYDGFYAQRIEAYGFISGVLYTLPTAAAPIIDSVYVESVDFGVWGSPGINNRIGAIQAKTITQTQGVAEHVVYWTQQATRSVGSYIGSVEVDGIATNTSFAVQVKTVDDFRIGHITGKNIGALFNAVDAKGGVGFLSARSMTEMLATDNNAVVLAQTSAVVSIDGADIESNVAGTDSTNKSRVFDSTTSSKLIVKAPHVRMTHATPGAAFRASALAWYHDPVIEYDNAPASGIAAFMVAGTKSSTVCQYIYRPYLSGTDQLIRPESSSVAYECHYDPNLVNAGVPGTTTIVSGAATHHTRFVAELETPSTIVSGTTQPQIRGSNAFVTANAGLVTITKFQSGTNGQRFYVRAADANTTIADNADIVTKGNANHALATGEVVWFQYLNGVAYEIQNSV